MTATDTGVGKTEAACALLSLLADAGHSPAPFKPYESGCEDLSAPADAVALRQAARSEDPLERICPHRFALPLAPGVAAGRLGLEPDLRVTMAAYRSFKARSLVAEGAGGLRVPLDSEHDVIDLIRLLRLPVLLVARAGLGTLNHTALSLEALARRRIRVSAVLLVQAAPNPDPSARDNARLLALRHPEVKVLSQVRFHADPKARRAAFRRALRPLVEPESGG